MLKQSVHGLCGQQPEGKENISAYLYLHFPRPPKVTGTGEKCH